MQKVALSEYLLSILAKVHFCPPCLIKLNTSYHKILDNT
jgi:hypothetical protein